MLINVKKRRPERRDVVIDVPMALAGFARGVTPEGEPLSPQEVLKFVMADREVLSAEVKSLRGDVAALRRDLRQLGDMASSISSVALSLTRICIDNGLASGSGEVRIPQDLHERMLGASIILDNDATGIRVRLRGEGRERVVPGA